jgi:hypothetical protein
MTKTLEQIQQENRKFILEAIYGTRDEALKNTNLFEEIRGNYNYLPLTLTTLLLALYKLDANFGGVLAFRSNKVFINIRSDIPWDIEFEALEQQSEQFQKDINKLITDKLIINKLLTNKN